MKIIMRAFLVVGLCCNAVADGEPGMLDDDTEVAEPSLEETSTTEKADDFSKIEELDASDSIDNDEEQEERAL